ncbi:MAG: hypothetical protein IJH30_03390 [Bacillus sp. (in: Bacteria)]|nr:hypothetical protein [Bacillus sp. (in: firmicutes)]
MKKIEQSLLAEERVKLTEFPPSIVEPNQSLSIQEIIRNVTQTGQTGLATGLAAEYDDDDQNNDDGDFDDPTLSQEFDRLDALNELYKGQHKYDSSVKGLIKRNKERLARLREIRKPRRPGPLDNNEIDVQPE